MTQKGKQSKVREENVSDELKSLRPGKSKAVGSLCRNLPAYVRQPPIEAVVFGWGVAEDGQLGIDTEENIMMPKVIEALLGTRFFGRSFMTAPLIGGSRNSLALDADGQVLSWGWNARGTLGLGHGQEVVRKPKRVSALGSTRITQVTIGGWHCLALAEGGQAYAWGGNEYGQCGLPPEQRDVKAPTKCVPHLRVIQCAAGGMHSCVLTSAGEIWTWGEPWGDFSMQVDRQPRKIAGTGNIAKIACGAFHNLALTQSGHVLAWGINDFGQLGNGSTDYKVQPSPVKGLEEVEVADIAAGGWHSLAITAQGELFIWGRGEYGRLGLGDSSSSSKLRATKVAGLEGHRVVQASCGGTHTMALTQEGRIFAWGRCSFGRLGGTMERDCYSPVEIFLPGGPERWHVISVCCGGRHSLALAVPDNEASSVSSARASRMASRSGSAELQQLPPGEPLDSATDREGSATDRDDAVADGESSATTRDNPATNRNGSRTADEADGRPPVPAGNLNGQNEVSDGEEDTQSPQPGGGSPQDLVDAVDRLEAEEDEEERELNGGMMPNGSRDLDEAGLLADDMHGGDSPGLPAGRPNVSQQQLETMLSMHGLRDEASDD